MPMARGFTQSGGRRRARAGRMAGALGALLLVWACNGGFPDEGGMVSSPGERVALDPESRAVAEKVQANLKEFLATNRVPHSAKVTLKWVKKSPYEGMYEAHFEIALGGHKGRRSFFFDREAKHFVMGPVYTVGELLRRRIGTQSMVLLDRAARGPEQAPIVIAEYSDFQCPYCSAASRTVKAILDKYKGQVRVVFKHMPLKALHSWAYDASMTAECAAAQRPEAFWDFYDYFFDPAKHLEEQNFREKTRSFAKSLDLDVAKLKICVDRQEPKARIDYDLDEAIGYGFTSTPTFVINGVVIVGNQSLSVFEEIIEEELRKAAKLQG